MTGGDQAPLRIGARFPNAGRLPSEIGLAAAAQKLEAAGFDSLWTSDHVAMPVTTRSRYPFSDDGRIPWPLDMGWSDAIVSLGIAAAVTDRIELGTAVLVAPMRNPLLTAMQLASVSVEAGGRCVLGIGAGWLAEEFDAMGVPFSKRGERMDAWIEVVRAVWSGALPVRAEVGLYPNATEMICRPVPVTPIPLLVGGMSEAALQRAAQRGDGWVALQSVDGLDPVSLAKSIGFVRSQARDAGRETAVRITLQITGSAGRADTVSNHVADLVAAGVDEVIVDIDWGAAGSLDETLQTLRAASLRAVAP